MNPTAERQVVAACLGHPKALLSVRDWLTPDHFADADLGALYRVILGASHDQIDPVTLGLLAEESGIGWQGSAVIELAGECLSPGNVVAHAELVVEAGRLRMLAETARKIERDAASGRESAEQIAGRAQVALNALCSSAARSGPVGAKQGLRQWHREFMARMAAGGAITGLPTPWADVNTVTKGLQPGRLYVIAGRPGMGKSVFGENIATFNALSGGRPLVFSLEMSCAEWWQRTIAQHAKVAHDYLASPAGSFDDGDLYAARVGSAVPVLMETAVEIDETPSLTLSQIEARAERSHMRKAVSMIVVDHMHIIGRPRKNDVSELGEISAGMKRLAKRLNVPVVALAQLNRANTDRTNKRPTMADLRGSGDIEQDADVILLAHREDYYRQHGEARDHMIELIAAKNRGGQSGMTINLRERFDQMRADDWDGPMPEREDSRPKGRGKFAK